MVPLMQKKSATLRQEGNTLRLRVQLTGIQNPGDKVTKSLLLLEQMHVTEPAAEVQGTA
jgi:IS1 family transposase